MKFKINNTSENAREAEIHTARGVIQTPAFMPVGTNGGFDNDSRESWF